MRLTTVVMCELCLQGVGGECHTPGCSLWMHVAPDTPVTALGSGATLVEAARKLVEGRYNPGCEDRSATFDRSCNEARQWTVWLTRQEHARYRAALAQEPA